MMVPASPSLAHSVLGWVAGRRPGGVSAVIDVCRALEARSQRSREAYAGAHTPEDVDCGVAAFRSAPLEVREKGLLP